MNPPTTDKPSQIREWLRTRTNDKPAIVSIDGLATSGKSFLAKILARELGASHVEVDDFVEKDQGTYVDHIRVDALLARVQDYKRTSSLVVLEGVCIDNVLARLSLTADHRIYVKQLDKRNEWFEGEIFTGGMSLQEALAHESSLAKALGGELKELDVEVITYHFERIPHEHADYIFHRFDSTDG